MTRSSAAAKAATEVAAIATGDGHAVLGGRPASPAFLEQMQREASGMPPAGAVDVRTRFNGEPVDVPVSVAREALYRHMDFLRSKITGSGNILNPYQFAGNGNPYLAEQIRQRQIMEEMAVAELEQARAELERLGRLSEEEVVHWAVNSGKVGRSHAGHWVVM